MRTALLALCLTLTLVWGCTSIPSPDGGLTATNPAGATNAGDFLAALTPANVANTLAVLNEKVGQLNDAIGKGEAVALAFQAAADTETDPAKRQANADKAAAKMKDVEKIRAELRMVQTFIGIAQVFAGVPTTQPASK